MSIPERERKISIIKSLRRWEIMRQAQIKILDEENRRVIS